MIGYVTIGSNEITRSLAFYDAVLAPLGFARTFHDGDWAGYGAGGKKDGLQIYVCKPENGQAACLGNGSMLAFEAPSRAAVESFHAAALAYGGACSGPPGVRGDYDPPMYMAYVRDPEGNKFAAYYKG